MGNGGARFAAQRLGMIGALTGAALVGLSVAPVVARAEPAASTPQTISIPSTHTWTDTAVDVRVDETVHLSATGTVHFSGPHTPAVGPNGIPLGRACNSKTQGSRPAPGIDCWSLIGRIGNGRPFAVGAAATLHPARAGRLFLGVNDNYLRDNSGAWSVTLVVTPATSTPAPQAPITPAAPDTSGGSNTTTIIALIGAGLVLLLAFILFVPLRRRRRREHEAEAEAELALVEEPPTVAPVAAVAPVALAVTEDDETVVPVDPDSAEVNIFEVDLTDGSTLRVGYNYFPEGTRVVWVVVQGIAIRTAGEFTANGGGNTYHYVSFPLESALRPDAGYTSVRFNWTIGGVPFEYSVRRDPAVKT